MEVDVAQDSRIIVQGRENYRVAQLEMRSDAPRGSKKPA